MGFLMNISNIYFAIKELGLQPIVLYAIYRLGLVSGYYRLRTPVIRIFFRFENKQSTEPELDFTTNLLSAMLLDDLRQKQIIGAADEITHGKIKIYGAIPTALHFKTQPADFHWTRYETGRIKLESADIKDIWEPARFSWVFLLGQAYHLTNNEEYPSCFWKQFEAFHAAFPPNIGPHWMNGQEVALRLIAFAFASQVFHKSSHSTPPRETALKLAIKVHAERIMATLVYARSQHNNHLLSEGAGLYTASLLLSENTETKRWKHTGWKLFIQGLREQIAQDGSYIQQSISYHRLMLNLAVWVQKLSNLQGACSYPDDVIQKLSMATHWLENLVLPENGHAPNMGANDGADIMPLGGVDVLDYRPVIQLARMTFPLTKVTSPAIIELQPEQVIMLKDGDQTALMRAASYRGRPSHADQLHLDLWWRNRNIALDPGSYRYNSPAPWNNALAGTATHNTITVDDNDQMIKAGRFLWLRWAKIHNLKLLRDQAGNFRCMSAAHDGYRRMGVLHKRIVESRPGGKPGWLVQDELQPYGSIKTKQQHTLRLVWLLPDWQWELDGLKLYLHSPEGVITIDFSFSGTIDNDLRVCLFRAGAALTPPNGQHPTWGWHSPTYGVKEPALAVHVLANGRLPIFLTSHWRLPM
jgi:hypothetical protein